MLEYIRKLWKITELRNKIVYTFLMLLLFRLVGCIPAPGIDLSRLGKYTKFGGGQLLWWLLTSKSENFSRRDQ